MRKPSDFPVPHQGNPLATITKNKVATTLFHILLNVHTYKGELYIRYKDVLVVYIYLEYKVIRLVFRLTCGSVVR